jgi:hypothetical protein
LSTTAESTPVISQAYADTVNIGNAHTQAPPRVGRRAFEQEVNQSPNRHVVGCQTRLDERLKNTCTEKTHNSRLGKKHS